MVVKDRIYGEFTIKEPVLVELLRSSSILRLKKISQFGIPDKYYHHKNFSRHEHSIGVMLLLRKLGAALEEQLAGLLHDVSTLAFSHVTDWVFAGGRDGVEDFHNQIHEQFFGKTEVPKFLEEFGFSLERILDNDNFPLLEREIPHLCADRIDYALREFKDWLNPKIVKRCIRGIVNYSGGLVFNDKEAALDFASNFLELQTEHWGGYEAMIRYYHFSKVLEIALKEKIIGEKDFYKDESVVLTKIKKSRNKKIKELLALLEGESLKDVKRDSGRQVFKKFRYVDPKVIEGGKLVRLSKLEPKFEQLIERHRQINKKGLAV